jgi:hypothetical protein
MGKTKMVGKDRDASNRKDCSDRSWTVQNPSGRGGGDQDGFVHVLWLLVVLSGLLFGAALVNIGIDLKIYESSSRHSTAMETLNLSVREVQKSILHLSKLLEEAVQPEEEGDTETPSGGGSI